MYFVVENAPIKLRRPWLAALLSLLCGPLGQVYVGRMRRGLALWLIGATLVPIVGLAWVSVPIGQLGFPLMILTVVAFPVFLSVDAFRLARRIREPLKPYQKWWVYILFFAAFAFVAEAVAYATRAWVAEAFVIPSGGMSPTIRPGDRILVDKLWTDRTDLRKGDVVVLYSQGQGSPLYVMRVAALPGDKIEIRNERVFINGAPSDDAHAVFEGPLPPPHYDQMLTNYGPAVIPDDRFFVLGDNRRKANDSRFLGPIPLADFYGKARLIFWSRERKITNPNDPSVYASGRIRWDRIGQRLD